MGASEAKRLKAVDTKNVESVSPMTSPRVGEDPRAEERREAARKAKEDEEAAKAAVRKLKEDMADPLLEESNDEMRKIRFLGMDRESMRVVGGCM